ncbi:MAG: TlpA family protein disulfide reductase [Gammaproteobacteria bacterium]|nr:TlpA family protein disulfide reductase [Gammaproteobacteria bacterium]MBU1723122.1 TlpA family protein disulfide reductase [Gammaproteobacteria bacterium]MBU2007423.1 TlpA family protein disulfide reductase [Gammaproteobacteria bacterium]
MKLDTKGIAILAFIAGIVAFFLLSPNQGLQSIPPATNIQTIDGKTIELDSLKGKPYLLTFWSVTCPGCVGEIPHLIELEKKMQGTGFQVIGVAMSYDTPPEIKAMQEKKGMNYTIAYDQSGELASKFDIRVTPTSFMITADGKIKTRKMGEWDPAELEQTAREMLKG